MTNDPGVVLAALLILVVMAGVAAVLNPSRQDFAWFIRLRRPRWLVFEGWIPVIWLLIYACFAGSAWITWQASWGWAWMVAYLLQLLLVQCYTLAICRSRSLGAGTAIGFAGFVWGVALSLRVTTLSPLAAGLLVPYLLWSPLGTVVTWQMRQLNRGQRPGRPTGRRRSR